LKTVFACSNIESMSSNPTQGMDIYLRLFCVCVGSGLATGWFPVQEILRTVLGLKNWNGTKRFTNALCSKLEHQERETESVESQPTFRRNISLPSSGPNNKPSKKSTGTEFRSPRSLLLHIWSEIPASLLHCSPPAIMLVSCSAYFSTLKMEACSSETSVDFQRIIRRNIHNIERFSTSVTDGAFYWEIELDEAVFLGGDKTRSSDSHRYIYIYI
jgi:hypothetical protein